MNKDFLTTTEVSKVLGISRIAVFKKIKSGEIKAQKNGRNYIIHRNDFSIVFLLKAERVDPRIPDKSFL